MRGAFALDLMALGCFRMGLGFVFLADLVLRWGDFPLHYTEVGVMPLAGAADFASHSALVPLHLLNSSAAWMAFLFGIGILGGLGLFVGLWTRASGFLCWVVLGAIQARNPLVLYGVDTLLMVLLFWSFFLPLGARLSLDAKRFGWRGGGQLRSLASAAYTLQIAVIYLFGALAKSGETWWSGQAVEVVLQLDQYTSSLGRWLLGQKTILPWFTWGTLLVEFVAPLLLLVPGRRCRRIGVALLVGLHAGFWVFMELGLFPAVSLVALLPLWRAGSPTVGAELSQRTVRFAAVESVFLAVALVSMLLFNTWGVFVEFQRGRVKSHLPESYVRVLEWFRLDQSWSMFSPDPPLDDGWLVVRGTLESGEVIDLFHGGVAPGIEKPIDVSRSFGSDRWKAYLLNLVTRRLSWERTVRGLVDRYERERPDRKRMVRVEVIFVNEPTGQQGKIEPVTLFDRRF